MPNTPLSALPYPTLTSANNPPADIQALATALDPMVTPQVQNYTVSWTETGSTPLSIGNGTLVGKYIKIGRLVQYRILLTRGSTSNLGTATYYWSLPVAADDFQTVGTGIVSVGAAVVPCVARLADLSTLSLVRASNEAFIGRTSFTWGTGDSISIAGSYIAGS